MPEIAIELTYEKIYEAASKLTEEDKERLFFRSTKIMPKRWTPCARTPGKVISRGKASN